MSKRIFCIFLAYCDTVEAVMLRMKKTRAAKTQERKIDNDDFLEAMTAGLQSDSGFVNSEH